MFINKFKTRETNKRQCQGYADTTLGSFKTASLQESYRILIQLQIEERRDNNRRTSGYRRELVC